MPSKKVIVTFSFFLKSDETNDEIKAFFNGFLQRLINLELPDHIEYEGIEVEDE